MTDMPETIWVELKPIDLGSPDGPFWAVTSGLADIEWDGATAYRRADLPPKVKPLVEAATAVIARWDSVDWKAAPTADVMNDLRAALAALVTP